VTDRGTDDELVETVRRALGAPPVGPSAAELATLRSALAVHGDASAPRRHAPVWRRPVPALMALILGATGVVSGGAVAVGAALPAPLRSAAVAIGLPVDDAALASAKAGLHRLQDALERDDRSAVAPAAAQLRRCLATLDAGDRAKVEPEADALLERAGQLLASPAPPGGGEPGGTAPRAPVQPAAPQGGSRTSGAQPPLAPTATTLAPRDGRPPDAATTTVAPGDGRPSGDGDDGRTATTGQQPSSVNATTDGDNGSPSASGAGTATDGGGGTDGGVGTDGGGGSDGGSGTSNGATGGH